MVDAGGALLFSAARRIPSTCRRGGESLPLTPFQVRPSRAGKRGGFLFTRTRPGTRPAFFHVFLVHKLVLISSCPPLRGGSRREDEFVVCANPNSSRDEIDEKDEFAFSGRKCPHFSALIFRQNRRAAAPTSARSRSAGTTRPGGHLAPHRARRYSGPLGTWYAPGTRGSKLSIPHLQKD